VVYNYLKTYAVGHTVYWQMVLGVCAGAAGARLAAGIAGRGKVSSETEKAAEMSARDQSLTKFW